MGFPYLETNPDTIAAFHLLLGLLQAMTHHSSEEPVSLLVHEKADCSPDPGPRLVFKVALGGKCNCSHLSEGDFEGVTLRVCDRCRGMQLSEDLATCKEAVTSLQGMGQYVVANPLKMVGGRKSPCQSAAGTAD